MCAVNTDTKCHQSFLSRFMRSLQCNRQRKNDTQLITPTLNTHMATKAQALSAIPNTNTIPMSSLSIGESAYMSYDGGSNVMGVLLTGQR